MDREQEGPGVFGTVAFDLRGYAILKCVPLEVEARKREEKYSDREHTLGDCLSRYDHLAVDNAASEPLPVAVGGLQGLGCVFIPGLPAPSLCRPCLPAQPPAGFP